jgi:DNA-binding NarL/FixJ family response regulator
MSDQSIRVFVVDDHPLVRSGVRSELEGRVEVVGTAGDVEEALAGIAAARPDVVLVDVHMPGGGGAELIRRVLGGASGGADADAGGAPAPRFLALSVSDAAEDVIAVIRAGARGYLTKTVSGAELAEAIGRVAAGDAVFSPRLAGFVLDAFAGTMPLPSDPELDQLTARERDVLALVATGLPNKAIARRLAISEKTVKAHLTRVFAVVGVSDRTSAALWAQRHGLT